MLLGNRIALVTGGAGRIGRAVAATLCREGARAVLVDRDAPRLAEAAAALADAHPGMAVAIPADVADEAAVEAMVPDAAAAFGMPDILVNAHGIFPNCAVVDVTVEEWDRIFAVNVRGAMLTCRALARRWIEDGTKGAIINISSAAATSARPGGAAYTGSKAAVNALTHVLAIELGPAGIRVNAVAPGLVLDQVVTAPDDGLHPYVNLTLKGTPLGRTGAAADIGEAVAFLASDRSAWTTGAILEVTGGTHTGRTTMPFTRQLR